MNITVWYETIQFIQVNVTLRKAGLDMQISHVYKS